MCTESSKSVPLIQDEEHDSTERRSPKMGRGKTQILKEFSPF